jgi:hypothetical protein
MITSCRHCRQRTASDRTPFRPMLARSIGSIGSLKRERAIFFHGFQGKEKNPHEGGLEPNGMIGPIRHQRK